MTAPAPLTLTELMEIADNLSSDPIVLEQVGDENVIACLQRAARYIACFHITKRGFAQSAILRVAHDIALADRLRGVF